MATATAPERSLGAEEAPEASKDESRLHFAESKVNEAMTLVTTTKAGITCSSAAVGGVAGGIGGGAAGAASGVALGVVPAVFTLGLSLPVGAAVGFCIGATSGGVAGAVGGGSVGYGGFTYRREIGDSARSAWAAACGLVQRAQGKTAGAAEPLEARVVEVEDSHLSDAEAYEEKSPLHCAEVPEETTCTLPIEASKDEEEASYLPPAEVPEEESSPPCADVPEEESCLQYVEASAMEIADQEPIRIVDMKDRMVSIFRGPHFQICTMVVAGSTLTIGTIGGAFGMAVGTISGSVAGALPALVTFGLSIPVFGTLGSALGLCVGGAVGSGAGALAGAGTYNYRIEIKDGLIFIKQQTMDTLELGKAKTLAFVEYTKSKTHPTWGAAKAKADELVFVACTTADEAFGLAKAKANEAVKRATATKTGIVCTSAAVGGIAGSVGGGTAGAASGAAVGVVPAVFTLGLSIPVGTAVGLCIGAAIGGAAGTLGGGAVGHAGFTYRKKISEGVWSAWAAARSMRIMGKAAVAAKPVKAEVINVVPASTTPVAGA